MWEWACQQAVLLVMNLFRGNFFFFYDTIESYPVPVSLLILSFGPQAVDKIRGYCKGWSRPRFLYRVKIKE